MSQRKRKTLFSGLSVLTLAALVSGCASAKKPSAQTTHKIDMNALFSDQGQLFFSPQEPSATDPVKVTLRSAVNNLSSANLVVQDGVTKKKTSIPMNKAGIGVNKKYQYWTATIPANSHYENYYFDVKSGKNEAFFSGNGATSMLPSTGWFAISPGFTTPSWAQNGIMYQIFVDRFYNGNTSNDVKTGAYTWYGSKTLHLKWGQDPETGDEGGTDQVAFSGGDLQGIQDKLGYITNQLGANILYLTPIFDAKTNHKYGVDNYFQVDPHFGGNKAFKSLVQAAHQKQDKVILDGVFNHTGASNSWFQKAQKSKTSPYYKWYNFQSWPNQYATFFGVKNLPKLNFGNPAVQKEVNKIAQYWLSPPYSADGWRLDSAGHVGAGGNDPERNGNYHSKVNHGVWQSFRNAVKSTKKDALIFGEFFENTVAQQWLKGNEWDGSVNYGGFIKPVSAWVTGKTVNFSPASESTTGLSNALFEAVNSIPRPAQLVQVNQLGTHDTARFGERAAKTVHEKNYPNGQLPYGGTPNPRKDVLGAMLEMTYTGLPTIYYGDEYGMMGGGNNDAGKRWPFNWNKVDDPVFKAYQSLISARKKYGVFVDGSFMPLLANNKTKVFAYARTDAKDRAIVVLNSSSQPQIVTVNANEAGSPQNSTFTNETPLLNGVKEKQSVKVNGKGQIQITVPANYGTILMQQGSKLY